MHVIYIPADFLAVRAALEDIFEKNSLGLDFGRVCDVGHIVLAEVLNNIVEHACVGLKDARITLKVTQLQNALRFEVRDNGAEMPGGVFPEGILPQEPPFAELPERGFGIHIIKEMVNHLQYYREGNANTLSFTLSTPD